MPLKETGLRYIGFSGAPSGQAVNPNNSDELRILEKGAGSLGAPRARILMNSTGQFVFWTGGSFLGSAEDYLLNPDDAFILYTRASTNDWSWVVPLPYPVPNINMNP